MKSYNKGLSSELSTKDKSLLKVHKKLENENLDKVQVEE
jgi:hypothetical protein